MPKRGLLRAADLRVPDRFPSRGRLLAGALAAATLASACTGGSDAGGGAGGAGGAGGGGLGCPIDDSNDLDEPYAGNLSAPMHDTICPAADEDFWTVTTTGPNKIVDVDLRLQSLSNIRLQAEWFGPLGQCVTSPTVSCSASDPCSGGDICDTLRGLCRSSDPAPCVQDLGCPVSTECATARASLATVTEDATLGGTLHVAQASLAAAEAGTYVMKVRSTESVAVEDAEYTLTLTESDNPDTHEPNDFEALATELSSGVEITAALATLGDEDWYHLDFTVVGTPVVTIDLSWPTGTDVEPTWVLCRPTCDTLAPAIETAGAVRSRRARILSTVAAAELSVHVLPTTDGTFDADDTYTLTVTVDEDPVEGATRNDTPDDATVVTLGAPSPTPVPFTRAESLAASNDQDWFGLLRPGASLTDNSLVKVTAEAADPVSSGFLLQLNFYRLCNGGSSFACPTSALELESGALVAPYFTWPSVDGVLTDPLTGEGSLEMGGHSPNYLEIMVPLFEDGDGFYFVAVTHVAVSPLGLPGYSPPETTCTTGLETGCYRLTIEHYAEPDDEDRLNADNLFVTRPLEPNIQRGAFYDHDRLLDQAGTQWTLTPRTGLEGYVVADAAQFLAVSTCGPVSFAHVDALGMAGGAASLSALTASAGAFVTDCTNLTPLPLPHAINGGAPTIFYNPPAAAADVVITTTVTGASTLTSSLTVAPVATVPDLINVTGPSGGALPAGFVRGGSSGTLSVAIEPPPVAAIPLLLEVTSTNVSGAPVVACVQAQDGVCFGLNALPAVDRCNGFLSVGEGGKNTCQILIGATGTFDVQVNAEANGPVTLHVSDPSGAYAPAYVTTTAYDGAVFEFGDGGGTMFYASGYISYAGDQDFFRVPLTTFPGRVGMTVNLITSASTADIRVTATRGDYDSGVGIAASEADLCDECGGGCNARGYCDQSAADIIRGARLPECAFVEPTGDLEIWVNDVLSNDWDLDQPYEFAVWLDEGCPATCDAFVCGGGQ